MLDYNPTDRNDETLLAMVAASIGERETPAE
jgi:hypothetical protein